MKSLIEELEQYLSEAKVEVVGFASGQDPDDSDDEWAGDIEVKGSIQGREVAQLLGKQQRVLERSLSKLTPEKALALIANGRNKVSKDILKTAKVAAQRFVKEYAMDEFERGAKLDSIDFSEDESMWTAKIDPKKERIDFTIELGANGEWK